MENKETKEQLETRTTPNFTISDDWYTQALEDMEDFIEEQGIYIRQ